MKRWIKIFLCLFSCSTWAWEIKQKKGDYFLSNQAQDYAIFVDIGKPKFLNVKQLNADTKLVIHQAGEVGTSSLAVVKRCLVFKHNKYVDNVIYSVTKQGKNIGTKWQISDKKVELYDLRTGRKWTF